MKAMIRMTLYSLTPAAVLAAMTLTAAQPASADTIDLPAGTACQDFSWQGVPLEVHQHRHRRVRYYQDGRVCIAH